MTIENTCQNECNIIIRTVTNLLKCVFARHNYYEICTYIERGPPPNVRKLNTMSNDKTKREEERFRAKINYTLTHWSTSYSELKTGLRLNRAHLHRIRKISQKVNPKIKLGQVEPDLIQFIRFQNRVHF